MGGSPSRAPTGQSRLCASWLDRNGYPHGCLWLPVMPLQGAACPGSLVSGLRPTLGLVGVTRFGGAVWYRALARRSKASLLPWE